MQPADHVPLGKTRLTVTRLGLGTVPLAGLYDPVTDEDALDVIRRAYDMGLRLIDTAPLYGFGRAETLVGRVLAPLPRENIVLATKVGGLVQADISPNPQPSMFKGVRPLNTIRDFSYDGAMRSVHESLQRLGLDRIDILHIHDPDLHYGEALSGAYRALDKLRGEGMIGAVGVGMNQAEMLARFAREGDFDCFLVAGRYTLLDQVALQELLPLCVEKRIAVIIGGVYNSGILADPRDGAPFNYAPANPEWIERARRLQAVCTRYNVPLKAAAIQFPMGHPAVVTVLAGARSVAELEDNAQMFSWKIPSDLWQELRAEGLLAENALVPAPGGPL